MTPIFLRLRSPSGSIIHRLKKFDWLGSILFVGSALSFLMPLTWGVVQYAWSDWQTLFPLILGIVALCLFGVYESRLDHNATATPQSSAEPIMRVHMLANYEMAFSLVATAINSAIVYACLYFLPLYYEAVQGYNPIIAGVTLFPSTFTVAPMSIVAGIIITKRGEFRTVTWAGWIMSTLGLGVMILLDVDTSVVQWVFITLTLGVGLGLLYTAVAIINQAAATDELMSFAISMFIFSRMMGQCLGVAISGVIFQNRMKTILLGTSLADQADEYSQDASGLVTIISSMSDGVQKQELVKAYADSLKTVWAVFCALSGAAMVGSFFLRHLSLDREHKTEQGIQRTGSDARQTAEDPLAAQPAGVVPMAQVDHREKRPTDTL